MKSTIPLTVAVVGALLVGGATTGTTRASWTSQAPLHSSSASSGQMGYAATDPTGVTVDKLATSTANTTFVLDDTSEGKNLSQRITASVATATLPAGITATIGATCPAAGTSVSVDTTPTSPNQTLCVRVTSSTTAVTGNVTINLSSAQRPTAGWTTPTVSKSFLVTVNQSAQPPAAPVLECVSTTGLGLKWNATGTTYNVTDSTNNGTYSASPSGTGISATTFTRNPFQGNTTFYFRVVAVTTAGTSSPSNIIRIVRSGSGTSCASFPVAP